jgi:hypothetical protein
VADIPHGLYEAMLASWQAGRLASWQAGRLASWQGLDRQSFCNLKVKYAKSYEGRRAGGKEIPIRSMHNAGFMV